jgi:hypothetical protein
MPPYLIVTLVAAWVAVVGLAIGLILTYRRMSRMERRYQRLVEGASGERLEEILLEHIGSIQSGQQEIERLGAQVGAQGAAVSRAIQHVGLVRFNPFDDTGGNYSFALALADGQGKGVLLCSLHGRGSTRIYAKPVVDWSSPVPLSEEEQQAVSLLRTDASRVEE